MRILDIFRRGESFSRTDLVGETGLDAKTITNVTLELLNKKLIIRDKYEKSGGGRPRELLRLNSELKYSVGIYLSAREIKGVLIDLKGKIIREKAETLNGVQELSHILSIIRYIGKELMYSITASKLLGLGFVMPGIIDKKRERVIQAATLPYLEGINIKERLKRIFVIPVEIEDSSRAMALAEKWFGKAQDIDNFIFVDLGIGIGCSIISNGRLHYGESLSAGELGHTIVDVNGPRCRCRHRGCLERMASTREIVKKASRLVGKSLDFDEVIKLNKQNDKRVQKIIAEAGYYIGVGVSNMINLLNPSHLIIGGELSEIGNILFNAIDNAMRRYTVSSSYNVVKVIPATLGDKGGQ